MAILDALQYLGETLDKPGAAVRGLLAGRPDQLANLIPFSDTLGITNPQQRTSGRGLLEKWGLLGQNDPDKWFEAGDIAGFGVDILSGIAGDYGVLKGVSALGRMAGRFADEAVKAPTLGVFGGALGDFSKYGAKPRQIDPTEAERLFKPWADALTPEESEAIRLFTTGPQDAISDVLRQAPNPRFPYGASTGGAPPIISEEAVLREVLPYADAAMAKGAGVFPEEIMTYRLAERIGDLNTSTANSLIGQKVADPSYLSTTLNPHGMYYGGIPDFARPREMKLDIIAPRGTPVAYPNAGKLSGYPGEQELMLGRGLPMEVLDTQKIQTAMVPAGGRGLYPKPVELTQSGVPIPPGPLMPTEKTLSQVFNIESLNNYIRSRGGLENLVDYDRAAYTKFPAGKWGEPVPSEILAPGWQDVLSNAPRQESLNVLLRAMPEQAMVPDVPIRRLVDAEKEQILREILPKAREIAADPVLSPHGPGLEHFDKTVDKVLNRGYSPQFLDSLLSRTLGLKHSELANLLKTSVPKESPLEGMLEVLKRAGIPIAGVGGAMSPLLQEILGEAA